MKTCDTCNRWIKDRCALVHFFTPRRSAFTVDMPRREATHKDAKGAYPTSTPPKRVEMVEHISPAHRWGCFAHPDPKDGQKQLDRAHEAQAHMADPSSDCPAHAKRSLSPGPELPEADIDALVENAWLSAGGGSKR